MKKICVTGGAGFIASHVVDHMCRMHPGAEIIVIDKMGYASRRAYLAGAIRSGQTRLVQVSICDTARMRTELKDADLVIHAAAESHVDNSYRDISPFLRDNIEGTISVLSAAVRGNVGLFLHVSTDEVYGESPDRDFTHDVALKPTNPYAASKASAEMFVQCFASSYGLPTMVSRANNIYGTRQYPEKLIPSLICSALRDKKFQVHGNGTAVRSFLHVSDFCNAVSAMIRSGEHGAVYNVPALNEYSVLQVVDLVCDAFDIPRSRFVEFGPDRPHNDCRYGVCGKRLRDLGWEPTRTLAHDIEEMIDWYRDNLGLYYPENTIQSAQAVKRLTRPFIEAFPRLVSGAARTADRSEDVRNEGAVQLPHS